jgi:predicted MFS family arabinose efflux permease
MPTETIPAPSARSVLGDRSVRLILITTFLHSGAVIAQFTAVGKLVYDISHRELDLGWLGLAEFAPALLLVTVTGTVADRFDRRRVAALSLLGEAVCSLGLAWYAHTGPTSVGPIYVIAAAFGTFRAFTNPAMRSLPVNIAPDGALPRVTAFYSTSWQVSSIAGPVIGGVCYAIGAPWPFVVAGAMAAVSGAAILTLQMRRAQQRRTDRPTLHSALEGFRFVRATPILLGAIALDLFAVLFGGAVALLPAIAENRLGVGAVALGFLRAAGGIGAALTALFLAWRPVRRRVGRKLLVAVFVFGIGTVLLGVTRQYWVALVAMAVLMGADMVSVFIRGTVVPLATPDAMRGRVMAVENVFIGGSNELGAWESGMAGQYVGTTWAVAGGGLLTLLIVGIWWVAFPALRDVDRFDDVMAPPGGVEALP